MKREMIVPTNKASLRRILLVLFINIKKKIGVSRNTLSETIPHIKLKGELKTEFTEKGI